MTFNISVISDVFAAERLLLLDPPVKVVNEEVSAACEMATFKSDVKNITNGTSGNCFQYELLRHIVSEKTPGVKPSPCEP